MMVFPDLLQTSDDVVELKKKYIYIYVQHLFIDLFIDGCHIWLILVGFEVGQSMDAAITKLA